MWSRLSRRAAAVSLVGFLVATAVGIAAEIRLVEQAAAWGMDFRHHDGASGRRYLPETMGSGVVLFDYDEDGDTDVFLLDGGPLPGSPTAPYRSVLFRNDACRRTGTSACRRTGTSAGLTAGGHALPATGERCFVDRTDAAGIDSQGFGAGAVAGDVDGDGDLDLYLTAYGRNSLWLNQGDGSFRRAAAEAGVDDDLWGTSASFADADRDGDLDLYVANYVDFAPAEKTPCRQQGVEVYCHPGQYNGLPDRYYRNLGDGRFEEVSKAAGLQVASRAGLGVAFADFDDDGWPDLYVANDAEANFLFENRGDGTFEETALLAGTAYGDTGRPEAGMGVAVGDVTGDGLADIFVTNFELETNALYRNAGAGLFVDIRFAANIAEASLLSLAFGVEMADLDHDGDLDLVIANGHILDNARDFHPRSSYAQRNQVFENLGGGRFREAVDAGPAVVRVSRGLAAGDLNGDGDLDFVINNVADAAELYDNQGAAGSWLRLDLRAPAGNRRGVGARVLAANGAGPDQVREVRSASSYLSQSEETVHFGLGRSNATWLTIRWPDGRLQKMGPVPADRRLLLTSVGLALDSGERSSEENR